MKLVPCKLWTLQTAVTETLHMEDGIPATAVPLLLPRCDGHWHQRVSLPHMPLCAGVPWVQPLLLPYLLHLDLALSRAAPEPDGPASPGQAEDRALMPGQHAALLQVGHWALRRAVAGWLARVHPRQEIPGCPPNFAVLRGARVREVTWKMSETGNPALSIQVLEEEHEDARRGAALLLLPHSRLESSHW